MARKRNLSRLALRFAAVLPFIPMFAAACGGSDTLSGGDDGGPDSATPETDGAGAEGGSVDTGADATGVDGTVGDDAASGGDAAGDDSDASHEDASDASHEDAGATDASDEDASHSSDASQEDASDASDASHDASHPSDASDDAGHDSDADASDNDLDASDASDASKDSGSGIGDILGQAADFAVFGSSTVTNTGITNIDGDLGSSSSTAIGTTEPVMVAPFAQHLGDLAATNALASIQNAYDDLIPGNLPGCALLPADVGGMTVSPGVYCFSSGAATITGVLTLDAKSDPNAVWVFQVASSLTVEIGSSVVIKPGSGSAGQVCNSYWQVGSAATLKTGAAFGGNILAQAAVSLGTGVTLLGRAFADTGAVTLLANTVDITGCAAVAPVP
jgi:hypothetical protein